MRRQALPLWLVLLAMLLPSCGGNGGQLRGWRALQSGTELGIDKGAGPQGEDVLAVLHTISTGHDYAIERSLAGIGLDGSPRLRLQARATRVLHLALVLVDSTGSEHECVRTLLPDGWRELACDSFEPHVGDWSDVVSMRLEDRTGGLGGQGPVSLKLVGLPLDE